MVVTEQDIIGESSDKDNQPDREKMKAQILIVDDAEINREFLSEILKEDYHILQAQTEKNVWIYFNIREQELHSYC